ncbi:MAG TPA: flavin reductase family protein [Gemmatimonadaceae bacterium]|nr:flavin reductase family protein [Gemmatimonadaceae bacterium]
MSVNEEEFRSALGRFAVGVTVVTTRSADGEDHGMTVSAFCSLSLQPPLILVCIDKAASIYDIITTAPNFVVNVLSMSQEPVARRFSVVDIDRFEGVGFSRGRGEIPVIDDAVTILECRRTGSYDGGDHTIIVGEVEEARWSDGGRPLLYYRGGYAQLER